MSNPIQNSYIQFHNAHFPDGVKIKNNSVYKNYVLVIPVCGNKVFNSLCNSDKIGHAFECCFAFAFDAVDCKPHKFCHIGLGSFVVRETGQVYFGGSFNAAQGLQGLFIKRKFGNRFGKSL